jgi:hypothetical protein
MPEVQKKYGHEMYKIARRNGKFLNAEWILRIFGKSHMDVGADKTQNWPKQLIWGMSNMQLQVYTMFRWPAGKAMKEENLRFWFECICKCLMLEKTPLRRDHGMQLTTLPRYLFGTIPTCIKGKIEDEQQFDNRSVLDGGLTDADIGVTSHFRSYRRYC